MTFSDASLLFQGSENDASASSVILQRSVSTWNDVYTEDSVRAVTIMLRLWTRAFGMQNGQVATCKPTKRMLFGGR